MSDNTIEDKQDLQIALQRLLSDNRKERVSLEALEKRHGLVKKQN